MASLLSCVAGSSDGGGRRAAAIGREGVRGVALVKVSHARTAREPTPVARDPPASAVRRESVEAHRGSNNRRERRGFISRSQQRYCQGSDASLRPAVPHASAIPPRSSSVGGRKVWPLMTGTKKNEETASRCRASRARQMTPMRERAATHRRRCGDRPARALAPRNREMTKVDAVIVQQPMHCRGKMNDSKRPLI
jgi:hypothetical protein